MTSFKVKVLSWIKQNRIILILFLCFLLMHGLLLSSIPRGICIDEAAAAYDGWCLGIFLTFAPIRLMQSFLLFYTSRLKDCILFTCINSVSFDTCFTLLHFSPLGYHPVGKRRAVLYGTKNRTPGCCQCFRHQF